LSRYAREDPLGVAGMMANKMRWMWRGSSGAMLSAPAVALQILIVALAVVGLVILAVQRRFEALLIGGLILGLTVFSGVVLAAPRRNLALMPLVMTLASTGIVTLVVYARAAIRTRALQPT
ncbi:MAG TPA: hypothetical protein VH741_02755, partial [Candidatus Limnocylindrales bacterium]